MACVGPRTGEEAFTLEGDLLFNTKGLETALEGGGRAFMR